MGTGLRVGVFGGTFDPPHLGHLSVAQEVAEAADLDRVLWIPAARPPHKLDRSITDAGIRAEMVAAAIRGNPRFALSRVELEREGISYTVDTLGHLAEQHPEWDLFLLMGADQVAQLSEWRRPEEIGKRANVLAFGRAGGDAGFPDAPVPVRFVPTTRLDISASLVRRRIADRQSIRYMVPDSVLSIIEREQLYRSGGDAPGPTGPQ